jgi:uncharacterized protein
MNSKKSTENNNISQSVLITGGSGLIGSNLTSRLLNDGFNIVHLSRRSQNIRGVKTIVWDPEKGKIYGALPEKIDAVIHLAGASIGEKRWTESRKKEIISSRVDTARLLFRILQEQNNLPLAFITASAIGYYGSLTSDRIFSEDDEPADDFLGNTCRLWEEAADQFMANGVRTVKIRTAVVLEKNDSALSKILKPAKYGLMVRAGSGKQYFPWIHISDLCNIYIKALNDNRMNGVFNAVAPEHVSHDEFIGTLARVMHKPLFLPHVPAKALEFFMGEMSDIILKGSRISSGRITAAGYNFRFPDLEGALREITGS